MAAEEPKKKEPEVKNDEAGLDDDDDKVIKLVSKEGTVVEIGVKAAKMSKFIQTALENDEDETDIKLLHVEAAIVTKLVSYFNYHEKVPPREIEKPLKSNNMADLVDEFDAKFTDVAQDDMFKLLLAANYLDCKPLLYLMCAKVASLMKGKTPAEIRKTFNIRDDYTPEEEEQIRKEHRDLIEC